MDEKRLKLMDAKEKTDKIIYFKRKSIIADGNCLFRAASLFLYGYQDYHQDLRMNVVRYIRENWNDLKSFAVLDDHLSSAAEYCKNMSRSKTYGTSLESLALSEIYQITFHIYH